MKKNQMKNNASAVLTRIGLSTIGGFDRSNRISSYHNKPYTRPPCK